MQAIQFEAQLKDGVIRLPSLYQQWQEGRQVKVIVLADDNIGDEPSIDATSLFSAGKDINHHSGKITLT